MKWRDAFYKFTAVYFLVTAATGLALYFRPLLGERAGWYSDAAKEWLVMLHNGELYGWWLARNRYASGLLIGGALAYVLVRFSLRSLNLLRVPPPRRRPPRR